MYHTKRDHILYQKAHVVHQKGAYEKGPYRYYTKRGSYMYHTKRDHKNDPRRCQTHENHLNSKVTITSADSYINYNQGEHVTLKPHYQ